jgi:outer membrane protein TolC
MNHEMDTGAKSGFLHKLWNHRSAVPRLCFFLFLLVPVEMSAGPQDAAKPAPLQNPLAGPAVHEPAPLTLTLQEAVLMSLKNNRALMVEQLNPSIQKTYEDQERAAFDPLVEGDISLERSQKESQSASGVREVTTDTSAIGLSLQEFFPTGTFVELRADTKRTDYSLYSEPYTETALSLSLNQPLLRGFGRDVNLVGVRQAAIETDISQYELRGYIENLVATVENTYWDYGLAQRQVEIVQESLKLAEQQLAETREMITVGTMAEAELVAGQAEVATQRQDLINARSAMAVSRLKLLRLLSPSGDDLWERSVALVHQPQLPEARLGDVGDHVATALKMRPEVNQAKLAMQREDLELVQTRNGLLPQMDFFINLGKSGYAESFGDSVGDLSGDNYYAAGGLSFEFPLKNKKARAIHQRATLRRDQAVSALDNLNQLVAMDVRVSYIEVERTREQIDASRATRKYQQENLRIETEKFRVGKSTSLLVAQVQRDFLAGRINEVQAVVNYLKALTDFYRLEGSLLTSRGIKAPE